MENAIATGVASMTASVVLADLMICPAGDQDFFQVEIPQHDGNLEVVIEHTASDPTVGGSLLNSQGVPIRNTVPVAGMSAERMDATYLPAGIYYVQTHAALGATSHYELSLAATGP